MEGHQSQTEKPPADPRGRRPRSERAKRRLVERALGAAPDRTRRSNARLGGAKLVKSQWQIEREQRAEIRADLSRVRLTAVLRELPELKFIAGAAGIRNLWQLSRATTATMISIPGLGPARLRKIKAYLADRGVEVAWEVR